MVVQTQTRVKVAKLDANKYHGLDRETLIHLYRTMFLSRRLDDREIQLKRQNKIYFQISSAGHEAVTAAMGLLVRPGIDWLYPYYRDRAFCLMVGVTPLETLLQAVCAKKLPLLYLIEDNGYAISVPVEVQTAGGSISKLVRDFPGLHVAEIDGTDLLESYAVGKEAVDYVRQRRGPALLHAHVIRPYSHSLSDDEKLYKTAEEREEEARRDPISKFSLFLVREGLLDQKEIEALEADVDREVREAGDQALAAEPPSIDSIRVNVYSPDVDPTSAAFSAEPQFHGAPKTMVEMVAATLSDEMARDERITVFGEDVADASRDENLKHLKGKGGVFKATSGLQRKYGHDRVFNRSEE